MKFTKTIEVFDCTAFNVGKSYYIHWRDTGNRMVKGIYLCDYVDTENNRVTMKESVGLSGYCPAKSLRFGEEDLDFLIEVLEVEFETIYNVGWHEWTISANVSPNVVDKLSPPTDEE